MVGFGLSIAISPATTAHRNVSQFIAQRERDKNAHLDRVAASALSGRNDVMSWFVPPIVVPAFLVLLIIARVAYVAYWY
jgi:hypothetical protein